jgi:hypothetical protein
MDGKPLLVFTSRISGKKGRISIAFWQAANRDVQALACDLLDTSSGFRVSGEVTGGARIRQWRRASILDSADRHIARNKNGL